MLSEKTTKISLLVGSKTATGSPLGPLLATVETVTGEPKLMLLSEGSTVPTIPIRLVVSR